ncbi:hypothetical protein Tco_0089542 [Tanacetum coccineum]
MLGNQIDLERDVVYRITDSWDEIVEAIHGTPVVTDVTELSQRMTEFETRVRQDIDDVYMRLDDEQSGQADEETDDDYRRMLAADHRGGRISQKALKLIKRLQTRMTEFERQQRPAKGPAQQELPEEASSSS